MKQGYKDDDLPTNIPIPVKQKEIKQDNTTVKRKENITVRGYIKDTY